MTRLAAVNVDAACGVLVPLVQFVKKEARVLLQYFYRISLEQPAHLACFIGEIRIDLLKAWIDGHISAWRLFRGEEASDEEVFFDWLRNTRGEFPPEGWPARNLRRCNGDHGRAIARFWGLLHEYLLAESPDWFVELNSRPIESQIRNGSGLPVSPDIRLKNHQRLAQVKPPGAD